MVILEAFAHGIAVISTPVGAIPEVIDNGRNGLIVPVGDSATLAAAPERLISDPNLRDRLGGAARQDHASRYEISSYVETFGAYMEKLSFIRCAALIDDPLLMPVMSQIGWVLSETFLGA